MEKIFLGWLDNDLFYSFLYLGCEVWGRYFYFHYLCRDLLRFQGLHRGIIQCNGILHHFQRKLDIFICWNCGLRKRARMELLMHKICIIPSGQYLNVKRSKRWKKTEFQLNRIEKKCYWDPLQYTPQCTELRPPTIYGGSSINIFFLHRWKWLQWFFVGGRLPIVHPLPISKLRWWHRAKSPPFQHQQLHWCNNFTATTVTSSPYHHQPRSFQLPRVIFCVVE